MAATTPPSPRVGSTNTAAVSSVTALRSASTSPKSTNVTGPGSGSNGVRLGALPVSDSAPIVRPWNEPLQDTIALPGRCLRASLIAHSFASAPLLAKKTGAGRSSSATRRSASAMPGSCMARLDVCASVATCADTAATIAGCA